MLNIPKEKRDQIAKGEVCDRSRKRCHIEDVEMSPAPAPAKKSLAQMSPATEIPSPSIKSLDVTDDESEESEDEKDESEESIASFSHNDHRKRKFSKVFGCPLDVEEKQLLNQYIALYRNMKEYGEDNVEKLCTLVDRLRQKGTFDDVECQEAFDAIRKYSRHVFV